MLCAPIQNHRYYLGNLTARARYFSLTRADQISYPLRSPNFLNCRVRMLRVFLQQRELLVGAGADVGGQGVIIVPEIRVRAVVHDGVVRRRERPNGAFNLLDRVQAHVRVSPLQQQK